MNSMVISGNTNLYPVNKVYQIDKGKMINGSEKNAETVDLSFKTTIF